MRTKVLLGIIGLLVILIALSIGCSISINTQKPKIDTVYVEKYWGSDMKLQKIDDSDGMFDEMLRISRNLISDTTTYSIWRK